MGTQYRSVIFYHTEEQKAAAEKVRRSWVVDGGTCAPCWIWGQQGAAGTCALYCCTACLTVPRRTCPRLLCMQAVAAANESLAKGTFRPVVGKSVATTIEPATDYYLAEVGGRE